METVTFDNLPEAVQSLTKEVLELKEILMQKNLEHQHAELISIEEAAELLNLSKYTIYSKVTRDEIPGVCKQGKRLYFESKVLIDWIKSGRRKTDFD